MFKIGLNIANMWVITTSYKLYNYIHNKDLNTNVGLIFDHKVLTVEGDYKFFKEVYINDEPELYNLIDNYDYYEIAYGEDVAIKLVVLCKLWRDFVDG